MKPTSAWWRFCIESTYRSLVRDLRSTGSKNVRIAAAQLFVLPLHGHKLNMDQYQVMHTAHIYMVPPRSVEAMVIARVAHKRLRQLWQPVHQQRRKKAARARTGRR